ncbi:T9SS type A sorting domain-containing protein [Hydrotalea sp.]|uniref:T9SS type A sorting domain-containing protein n=1 Tax=Hydrotalea sp. TaxID=2881279 RepID=UPI003D0FB200
MIKPSYVMPGLLLFIFLTIVSQLKATNYYVDPSSTASTQNGAFNTPWKSLSSVNSNMYSFKAGDTIFFKRGQTFVGNLNITVSGSAGKPIVFTTYGSATAPPVFQYALPDSKSNAARNAIYMYQQSYIEINGIKITDTTMNPNDHTITSNVGYGVSMDQCNYVKLRNLDISLVGVGVSWDGSSNNLMDSCKVYNLRMVRNTPTSVNNNDDYGANGIVVGGSNNIVTHNLFQDCWAMSYDYGWDGGAVEMFGSAINNNTFMYNASINNNGFTEIGSNAGGTCNNMVVAYNLLINNGSLAYLQNSGAFAITINNLQFYNNNIVETVNQLTLPTYMLGMQATSSIQNIIILKNNVFWLNTGISVISSGSASKFTNGQMVHQNNLYHIINGGKTNFNLDPTETLLGNTTAVFTNTSNSDASQWNYTLLNPGPAIATGQSVGLSTDYAGNSVPSSKPDIGMLQHTSNVAATNPLSVSAVPGKITCNGSTTTVAVTATGGTTPYTGTGNFTVGAGTYTYKVTDAKGDTASTTVTITQPTPITVSVVTGNITTSTGTTSVTASASGGAGGYTYSIDGGSFQTSSTFSSIGLGNHTVVVNDANGCSGSKSFTIIQSASSTTTLKASTTASNISCNGGTTSVTVTASGGTSPYTGTGSFTVKAGTYTYTVKDATGATASTSITITEPTAINVSINTGTITVYNGNTWVTATASGGAGSYNYSLDGGSFQPSGSFSNVMAGAHTIVVKDGNGCSSAAKNFTLTQPSGTDTVRATAVAGSIKCNGDKTTVTVSATGGTPPYTGAGTFTVGAGTYTYKVTDSKGNYGVITITVTEPPALTISVPIPTIAPYNTTTTVAMYASGGTGAFSYSLDDNSFQSNNLFYNVIAGTHIAIVKDANACSAQQSFTIAPSTTVIDSFKLEIKAFPNPTHNQFKLRIKSGSSQRISIYVYNSNGQLVYSVLDGAPNNDYNFGSNFSTGMFYVQVQQGTAVQTLKIMKL